MHYSEQFGFFHLLDLNLEKVKFLTALKRQKKDQLVEKDNTSFEVHRPRTFLTIFDMIKKDLNIFQENFH